MGLLDQLRGRGGRRSRPEATASRRSTPLRLERLEDRTMLDATGTLTAGTLLITTQQDAFERILLSLDPATNQLVLQSNGAEVGRFDSALVTAITITLQGHNNIVRVASNVLQPTQINGGPGTNYLFAGGGPTTLVAGPGTNRLIGGPADDTLDGTLGVDNVLSGGGGHNLLIGGSGRNVFFGAADRDTIANFDPAHDLSEFVGTTPPDLSQTLGLPPSPSVIIRHDQVATLLQRAAAATASDDGIVAIVDRGGRVLGVRVEGHVDPAITSDTHKLVFAIDGAIAEARTGAFFASNQAPLTSRTIQFISQTTITQQEVESDPSIPDPNSPLKGPGFVAPIGLGGHFPPGVPHTPQVDLFAIEHTNRDTTIHLGPSGIPGGPDSVTLPERFNVNPAFIPANIPANEHLAPPDSYGFISGREMNALPRGIGTLPGGIPILLNNVVVGGIGVFFPGKTGFSDEENSSLSSNFDPTKPDRSLEAEYVAFAALGGTMDFPIGDLGGIAPVLNPDGTVATRLVGANLPNGLGAARIDLVGITLPLFGPGGTSGPATLFGFGQTLGIGDPNSGFNAPLRSLNGLTVSAQNTIDGTLVPEGFLVTPHDGVGITAAQVQQMIAQGVNQALHTRAAIRLPLDSTAGMVFAVSDKAGNILGLFRMPDATIFSIDVAVAKARNVAYYADPNQLQAIDQLPGVAPGTAFTNRTFRFLALPRFPEGVDGAPPGPFSILNDGGADLNTGLTVGAPLPASAFQSVQGHDAFFPETNFHDPFNFLNQDGIVFFPGSVPIYVGANLVGGVGISGDGVDQDDVVTFSTKQGFDTPANVLRADQVFVRDVRLPYQKFNRQPLEP
jgi:uncharacterized protein GlcG (DUF336 family)